MYFKNTLKAFVISSAFIACCAYVDKSGLELSLLMGIMFILLYIGFEGETL